MGTRGAAIPKQVRRCRPRFCPAPQQPSPVRLTCGLRRAPGLSTSLAASYWSLSRSTPVSMASRSPERAFASADGSRQTADCQYWRVLWHPPAPCSRARRRLSTQTVVRDASNAAPDRGLDRVPDLPIARLAVLRPGRPHDVRGCRRRRPAADAAAGAASSRERPTRLQPLLRQTPSSVVFEELVTALRDFSISRFAPS